jgi:hypothetical protein
MNNSIEMNNYFGTICALVEQFIRQQKLVIVQIICIVFFASSRAVTHIELLGHFPQK